MSNGFFKYIVLTNKSYEFQSRVTAGETMRITKVEIGDGKVSDEEDLANLTSIKNKITDGEIVSITPDGHMVKISGVIKSEGFNKATPYREIGIYAQIDDEEILYAYINSDDKFDYIVPLTEQGQRDFSTNAFNLYLVVGDSANIEVTVNNDFLPDGIIDMAKLNVEVINYIDDIKSKADKIEDDLNKHTNLNVIGDVGAHGIKYDRSSNTLKYKDNNEWHEISTGDKAEDKITAYSNTNVIDQNGVHGFKYDKGTKKLKYYEDGQWYDVGIEGGGDISVSGLTPETIKTGVTVILKRREEEVKRIVGTYTSDATATADDILSGTSAYANGEILEGSIKKQTGDVVATPQVSGVYLYAPIPKGYYDNARVSIQEENLQPENIKKGTNLYGVQGTFTSDATATASDIMNGKIAYVNGNKLTGNMSKRSGDISVGTPSVSGSYLYTPIVSNGYYSGARFYFNRGNLQSENIKKGVNIFGIIGTLSPSSKIIGFVIFTGESNSRRISTTIIPHDRSILDYSYQEFQDAHYSPYTVYPFRTSVKLRIVMGNSHAGGDGSVSYPDDMMFTIGNFAIKLGNIYFGESSTTANSSSSVGFSASSSNFGFGSGYFNYIFTLLQD